MLDEFFNRLGMFETALGLLDSTEHKPTWFNQVPKKFTQKVAAAVVAVTSLSQLSAAQQVNITGPAADKKREEEELETVAHRVGCALDSWFTDHNDQTNAAAVRLPISDWRRLRDQALLQKARLVRDKAAEIVAGPDATEAADDYNISAAAVTALSGEIDDYDAIITLPQQSIAGRKAITQVLRPRFAEVEALFTGLDCDIVQFNTTEAGRALIAAYLAGRIIRDLGAGPAPPPPSPQPPNPPSP